MPQPIKTVADLISVGGVGEFTDTEITEAKDFVTRARHTTLSGTAVRDIVEAYDHVRRYLQSMPSAVEDEEQEDYDFSHTPKPEPTFDCRVESDSWCYVHHRYFRSCVADKIGATGYKLVHEADLAPAADPGPPTITSAYQGSTYTNSPNPPTLTGLRIENPDATTIRKLALCWEQANSGNKINAIKQLREATNLGLKEAKDWVEHWLAQDLAEAGRWAKLDQALTLLKEAGYEDYSQVTVEQLHREARR